MPEGGAVLLSGGGGTLEKRKGIYIVHLRGSYEDMGRQHAELALQTCGDVTAQYYNRLIEMMIAQEMPLLAGAAGWALKRLFHLRNSGSLGVKLRPHLRAFADAFGWDRAEAERIFFVPDIVHYMISLAFPSLAASPMCSGFFARDSATRDGKLLVGRNFDFPGRGIWNVNNAVIVARPDGGQAFCWLGALGVPGSPQGINESGLFICLFTKFISDVRMKGVPVFRLCHDVLAECETLDDAIARITSQPRMCGLTMLVVDTKRRDAAAIGFSANHAEIVRPANDVLARTNHYVTDDMKRFEIAPHPWQMNSKGRFRRVTELLEAKRGVLAVEDIPFILSDCVDPFEECRRVTGNVVAGSNNAQCVILSPDDDSLWIGNGDYPVAHSELFAGFRIPALLAGDRENYEIGDLPGAAQLDPTERAALFEYEQAWSAFADGLNRDRAVFHLRRAAALLPDEVIFPRMAGVLLLKQKKYSQALPLLIRNTEYDYKNELMKAESHVWAGRCLDLIGRREEALGHYEKAAAIKAQSVSAAAVRHMTSPFTRRELSSVSPDFVVATGLAKYCE
ncbi:MAG TPA: C45 family autoproteolytic acyltransferase/hydrolase [Candidatus Brocadiia bacterium]|nr:C45 family autoproteolytic acyltransferase/hydrolase [Candidatus Brocadiia bacterium]